MSGPIRHLSGPIHHRRLDQALPAPATTTAAAVVLPGEIDGLRCRAHRVAAGDTVTLAATLAVGRVCLFTAGRGTADDGAGPQALDGVALLGPRHEHDLAITAAEAPLRFLELDLDLNPVDRAELAAAGQRLPFFQPYATCPTYRERIKSPQTVSRTLLPEHTWPRLCVGSVQTTGPDAVAAHEHPMLEQLFLGLAGNDCLVRADEAQLAFGEHVLLHIPLGSSHGVEVGESRHLHYIWIDVFRDREGMAWITQEHVPDP